MTFMVISSVPGYCFMPSTVHLYLSFNPHNNFLSKMWLAHPTSEDPCSSARVSISPQTRYLETCEARTQTQAWSTLKLSLHPFLAAHRCLQTHLYGRHMILLPFIWPLFLRELSFLLSIWPHDSLSLLRSEDHVLLWPACSGPFPKGIPPEGIWLQPINPIIIDLKSQFSFCPWFPTACMGWGLCRSPGTGQTSGWMRSCDGSDYFVFCGHIGASCSQDCSPEESLGLCSWGPWPSFLQAMTREAMEWGQLTQIHASSTFPREGVFLAHSCHHPCCRWCRI